MMNFINITLMIKLELINIDVVFPPTPSYMVMTPIADLTLGHDHLTTFPLSLPLSSLSRVTIPDLWGVGHRGAMWVHVCTSTRIRIEFD